MPVTQHLCSIMAFVAVFTHLYERELRFHRPTHRRRLNHCRTDTFEWTSLVATTLLSSLLGYILWERLTSYGQFRTISHLFFTIRLSLMCFARVFRNKCTGLNLRPYRYSPASVARVANLKQSYHIRFHLASFSLFVRSQRDSSRLWLGTSRALAAHSVSGV